MSFCKALTLSEGLKKDRDVNGRAKFAENFTPGQPSDSGFTRELHDDEAARVNFPARESGTTGR